VQIKITNIHVRSRGGPPQAFLCGVFGGSCLLQKVKHRQNCGRRVREHRGYHFISTMGIASRRCHMPHWISDRHRRLWTERGLEPMTYQRLSE